MKTSKEGLGELGDSFVEPKAIMQRGCCRGIIIRISAGLIIAGFMVFSTRAASPAENPGDSSQALDLPPIPSPLPKLAKPARDLAILEGRASLNPVSTNQAELDLVNEIKTMQRKLQVVEEAAYAKDPLLLTCGKYIETTHDWVMKYHARELNAAGRYFNSGGQTNSPEVNKIQNMLIDLIDMDLFHEVANNTNWAPLLKAGFEATASRMPFLRTSYARNDSLIGFRPATAPAPVIIFEAYAAEIEQRSALVKAKLVEIQRKLAVPDEVVAGWWYGDLYRMLDGNAQGYLELRTPQALTRLREQLRRKYIDLSWLQAPSGTKSR